MMAVQREKSGHLPLGSPPSGTESLPGLGRQAHGGYQEHVCRGGLAMRMGTPDQPHLSCRMLRPDSSRQLIRTCIGSDIQEWRR
jgi:hypothetical protein